MSPDAHRPFEISQKWVVLIIRGGDVQKSEKIGEREGSFFLGAFLLNIGIDHKKKAIKGDGEKVYTGLFKTGRK